MKGAVQGEATATASTPITAQRLGMGDTRYVEPTGLSSRNQSSAQDLARLVSVASADPMLRELGCAPPVQKHPDMVLALARLMREAYADSPAPLPELPWVQALRQSGTLLLSEADHQDAEIEQAPEVAAARALMWLEKYCGRFPTPAREVLQARKLLRNLPANTPAEERFRMTAEIQLLRDQKHYTAAYEMLGEALKRDPARYLGFVEVHIEQGPVLNELDLPLGVVTSINGGVRYQCEVLGMASHAGTTPMDRRRDAAVAVAELAQYVEKRAASVPDVVGKDPNGPAVTVGTVGMLNVPNGSINVVPGRCTFSLDLRATTNAARDALAADVLAELKAICQRRGLQHKVEETMRASAAPSAPAWQQRWERAVEALGLPVFRMPSGAGHDAMKLHEVMPQAMLFVRGLNAGISHNPLESITTHDADLCVGAFTHLLEGLAQESAR